MTATVRCCFFHTIFDSTISLVCKTMAKIARLTVRLFFAWYVLDVAQCTFTILIMTITKTYFFYGSTSHRMQVVQELNWYYVVGSHYYHIIGSVHFSICQELPDNWVDIHLCLLVCYIRD